MQADQHARKLGVHDSERPSFESQLQLFGRCEATRGTDEITETDYDRFKTEGNESTDPTASTDAGSRDAGFQVLYLHTATLGRRHA